MLHALSAPGCDPGIDAVFTRSWHRDPLGSVGTLLRRCAAAVQPRPPDAIRDDSRRQLLTLMFTDIVESTALAERLGDDAWCALLARHHATTRRAISRFGGREVADAGDGFFVAFDRPGRALACVNAIRLELEALSIVIRAGVHTGECDVTGRKHGGLAVHVASRIAGAAGPGEVLVSGTVRDLVCGMGFEFRDRDWQWLKGLSEPRQLFALMASNDAAATHRADGGSALLRAEAAWS